MADELSISTSTWRSMTEFQREEHLNRIIQEIGDDDGENVTDNDFSDDEDKDYIPDGDASDVESEGMIGALTDIEDSEDEEILEELYAENNMAFQQQQDEVSDQYFLARDNTKWKKIPRAAGRIRAHNIVREGGGNVRRGMGKDPLQIFKAIITEEMINIVMRETNRKAAGEIKKYNEEKNPKNPAVWEPVTVQELYSYIGIIIAAGVNHSSMQHSKELWKTTAHPVFRATISLNRFWAINRFIRFDDQRTRAERQKLDKAAPIRDLWLMLNSNLEGAYTPTQVVTVDEQLFPYKGRTRFTQYIPSKPAKYGIKVWWACDSSNAYPCKGILYTGKESGQQTETNQGERVLIELTRKFISSGRTIVADNFFTTLEAVEKLRLEGMAFVGTVRRNKRCIPQEMLPHRSRPVLSTEFGFQENVSLISYVPKKNKAVLLLSSVHYNNEVVGEARKPEAILFYNKNKGGVDLMDQMLHEYTCKRQTNLWSLAFFYNMLDVAALASFILCRIVNEKQRTQNTDYRRKFLHSLVNQLVTPQIEQRMNNSKISSKFNVRNGIEAFFGKPLQHRIPEVTTSHWPSASSSTSTVKKSCFICRSNEKIQRKTRFSCISCANPICLQHSHQYNKCHKCINEEEASHQ